MNVGEDRTVQEFKEDGKALCDQYGPKSARSVQLDIAMKIGRTDLPEEVKDFLKPIIGKRCCRQRVSEPRAIHIGLGEKIYHGNSKLLDEYYGEWEIGTYYSAWRVLKEGRIICGSDDLVDSADELN